MNGVEYTVEDTGAFARYGVQFDVYYDNHAAASAHGHQTWEAYIADDNGSQEVTVTSTSTKKILYVTLTNGSFDAVARANLNAEQLIICPDDPRSGKISGSTLCMGWLLSVRI